MELLIIRHGLPVRRELTSGAADPELSEDGRAQAEHLARYLEAERIDAVYASPLTRARETAVPLATGKSLEVVISDGIAEFDQHSSEYVPVEELKAANDPRWQAMLDGDWGIDESEEDFRTRVVESIEGIIARSRRPAGRRGLSRRCHQRLPVPHPGSGLRRPRILLPELHLDQPRRGGVLG